ncbi:MAG: hypothetical protein CME06_08415 [Gemmatimonadetes bacterium]|nr:hypothetical protein [Gemmatimonadota bacterium]
MPSYDLIETNEGVGQLAETLSKAEIVGVDTEADSLYSYFDKVCLFQFSAAGRDYIVDPLGCDGIGQLAPIFSSPDHETVFHAAEYDVLCLKRDYDFVFDRLFDTMTASLLLGYEKIGLSDLLQQHFDVELDKRFQRAHWSQRPLPEPMLEYARLDTHYLCELRDRLIGELEQAGRLSWAKEEFALIAQKEWPARSFDPDDFRRIKGAGRLSPREQAVLKELFTLRDQRARSLDRPPFKVLGNLTLIDLAQARPRNEKTLLRVRGVSSYVVRRLGESLLAAIARGEAAEPPERPRSKRSGTKYDPTLKTRVKSLKQWRKKQAEPYGIQPHVLIPNAVLDHVAGHGPVTPDELREVDEMRSWSFAEVGCELAEFSKKMAS